MPSGRLDFTADLPRKRMAAGLLLTDPDQRVLLVEPAYQASWEIPGGCVEVDESPYQATGREAREELGLDLSPGRLLAVDWVPPRDGRAEGVMFVYDDGTLDAARPARIVVPPDELKDWAWSDPSKAAQDSAAAGPPDHRSPPRPRRRVYPLPRGRRPGDLTPDRR